MRLFLLFLIFIPSILYSQVSIGTSIPKEDLHLHDSIATATLLISTGNLTEIGLKILRSNSNDGQIFNQNGNLTLKGGDIASVGGELKLFTSGKPQNAQKLARPEKN